MDVKQSHECCPNFSSVWTFQQYEIIDGRSFRRVQVALDWQADSERFDSGAYTIVWIQPDQNINLDKCTVFFFFLLQVSTEVETFTCWRMCTEWKM